MIGSTELKDDIDGIDPEMMLGQVEQLPIRIWKYKPELGGAPGEHIGPLAEDLHRLFGVGDGKQVFLMDGIGISLAANQGLLERIKELEKKVADLSRVPVEVA